MAKRKTKFPSSDEANAMVKQLLLEYCISEGDVQLVLSKLRTMNLLKGECFSRANETSKHLGILLNGLLYAYYETGDGKEQVSRFYFREINPVVTSFKSFSNQQKSTESIVALHDSQLMTISFQDLQDLYSHVPAMNLMGRQLAEASYIRALDQLHLFKIKSNELRLHAYYKQYRKLQLPISDELLASYLSMGRADVSRYKKTFLPHD